MSFLELPNMCCNCNSSNGNSLGAPLVENNGTIGSVIIAQNIDGVLSGNDPLITVDENGVIGIGSQSNPIKFNSGICNKWEQINDSGTNYQLTDANYAVEIISATYTTVTLPEANKSGCEFIVARAFPEGSGTLYVVTQGSDTIDGDSSIELPFEDSRIKVISNGVGEWSVI